MDRERMLQRVRVHILAYIGGGLTGLLYVVVQVPLLKKLPPTSLAQLSEILIAQVSHSVCPTLTLPHTSTSTLGTTPQVYGPDDVIVRQVSAGEEHACL